MARLAAAYCYYTVVEYEEERGLVCHFVMKEKKTFKH
jgi:hypothetical protein